MTINVPQLLHNC